MKPWKPFLLMAMAMLPMFGMSQSSTAAVVSIGLNWMSRGAFTNDLMGEYVMGKRSSLLAQAGVGYGWRSDQIPSYLGYASMSSSLTAFSGGLKLRYYLLGRDGAPNGLFASAGFRCLMGTEKNSITDWTSTQLHRVRYKSGVLAGPELEAGYQFALPIGMAIGWQGSVSYLATRATYSPITYIHGLEGNFQSSLRFGVGMNIGIMIDRGNALDKYKVKE